MTSTKILYVSSRRYNPQEIFQIKGIQDQRTNVGIASPSQKLLKHYLFYYLLTFYVQ